MIDVKTIAQTLEKSLNAAGKSAGIQFRVFTEEGTFKAALKSRTEKILYTNAMLTVDPAAITPIRGVDIITQSATLEIVVQLFDPATDEQVITQYRELLNGVFNGSWGVTSITEPTEKKTYSVSSLYSLTGTGSVGFRDDAGTSTTFVVDVDYVYFQDGLNSYDTIFNLDGYPIPYTQGKMSKLTTVESDSFSDANGKGYSRIVTFTRGFDFTVPALRSPSGKDVSAQILDYLFGDDMNTVHKFEVQFAGAVQKQYYVTFANVSLDSQGMDNGGYSVSFVEVKNDAQV